VDLLRRYANWSGSREEAVDVSLDQPFKALNGYSPNALNCEATCTFFNCVT
jgi:hypothetical protein